MTNNDQSRKPAKPYLRKGSGATGRLMSKINYPTLTRTRSRQSHSSVNNAQSSMQDGADSNLRLLADLDCESANTINRNQWPELSTRSNNNINNFARSSSSSPAQDQQPGSSRPLTGTTDSGCPEDPLYLLSPALTEHLASVVRDVTTDADVDSSMCSPITYSDEGRLARDLTTHSVIYDVSDYSASAISTSGIGRVTPSKGELSDGRVVGDSSEQGGSTPSVVADVSTIHASSIGPVTTTTTAALPSKTRKLEAVSGKQRTESCALNREIAVILPPVQSSKQLKQYSKGVRMPKAVNLSLGESTAEFEHLEARVHEMLASEGVDGEWPASSDTSHNTDGTRSKHWRSVIADFRQEALKNNV
ncbi:unnamed protein product, partial [Anisakis simplex]|uniref:Uncharacterized protein n=1 Tax=Anisakis simplex TaxID=6269 RepID=A0A0M3J681_ANISI